LRTYFDSSVILDTLLNPESKRFPTRVERSEKFTSRLTQVEVLRSITKVDDTLIPEAFEILASMRFVEIGIHIIDRASLYPAEITLKSSDAIHIATAEAVLDVDDLLVTYDKQMARNAQALGYKVLSAL
jgi:predicted nucleic acid-binding protein